MFIRRFEVLAGNKTCEETYRKRHIDIESYIYEDYPSCLCDFGYVDGTVSHLELMKKIRLGKIGRIEFPISHEITHFFENIESTYWLIQMNGSCKI